MSEHKPRANNAEYNGLSTSTGLRPGTDTLKSEFLARTAKRRAARIAELAAMPSADLLSHIYKTAKEALDLHQRAEPNINQLIELQWSFDAVSAQLTQGPQDDALKGLKKLFDAEEKSDIGKVLYPNSFNEKIVSYLDTVNARQTRPVMSPARTVSL